MKNLSDIDTDIKITSSIDKQDIKFYSALEEPFKVYGVSYIDGKFRRIPLETAKSVNEGVYYEHTSTAGGRIRFRTDSPYVAIYAKMYSIGKMPHFPLTGSAGFDMYINNGGENYVYTFVPPFEITEGYEDLFELDSSDMRSFTINFPLYSSVDELYIGLSDKAVVCPPDPYKHEKPIVYYGSSITQGGCASRPGNSYEAIVSRRFDVDHVNLGFNANARGEDAIAEYISNMDMSVFVYDYDHNAPNAEHLKRTHERMFKIIRKNNPELPIIIMSRPQYIPDENSEERLAVIRKTYDNAKASHDDNVYLITGRELMSLAENEGTVDGCHPNDLGFASIARALGDVLEKIL